ncbi:hypothetical protein [uncultured Campylobacter sp.]|uniref:hypothetical protein n=1 Tax=uncultured Campylobacter sp. TaxID=218934 RepID=UPI00260D8FE3|nr:hypothetical protein [uncultured Campylobacter sp.]
MPYLLQCASRAGFAYMQYASPLTRDIYETQTRPCPTSLGYNDFICALATLLCSVVTDHHTFTAAGSAYLFAAVVRCFAKYYAMQ